jgi:hypothetical protein
MNEKQTKPVLAHPVERELLLMLDNALCELRGAYQILWALDQPKADRTITLIHKLNRLRRDIREK